jgi:CDP-glucose 4,6-dehydratase
MRTSLDAYRGKRVFVTGHTGFKGSWLSLWLHELGAEVFGVGLSPESSPNHWELLDLPVADYRLDIRDFGALARTFDQVQPEIIFHLAAQPLVRRSYRLPLETWSTNVMGTANVFEACRQLNSVRAIVAVTTDKCYENFEWPWGYRESDRLGGHDPYSASKAGSELVAASYRRAFFNSDSAPLLATARAGNVIGGGDWSEDRLIPDLVRATSLGHSLEVRSPQSTRPWQHVLESLSGYLQLGVRLMNGDKAFADAWNFGPAPNGNRPVEEVLRAFSRKWETVRWHSKPLESQPHEATLLYLDNSKARTLLGWEPVWDFDETVRRTAEWYRAWLEHKRIISHEQLADYILHDRQLRAEKLGR